MKEKFGLKQLILLTAVYLTFVLIDLAIDKTTGISCFSPRNLNDYLGLVSVGLLWIWYFVDKLRRK